MLLRVAPSIPTGKGNKMAARKSQRMSVYEVVTSRILSALENGVAPWNKPWNSPDGIPFQNLANGTIYKGINPLLLSLAGFSSPYWVTYKQAGDLGGNVKKGQHGTQIIRWVQIDAKDSKTGKSYGFLKYFTVFNVEQCEGFEDKIPAPIPVEDRKPFSAIDTADAILAGMENPPTLSHGGNRAYYMPANDSVQLPNQEDFIAAENYYSTAFHEFAHATGHESRLAREFGARFGDEKYSKEELIAEMTAAMLCGIAGIDNTVELSAAYIENWKSKIAADPKLIYQAAKEAQKASDYILGDFQDSPVDGSTDSDSE